MILSLSSTAIVLQTLKEKGLYKPGKPNMLFYADDMVLWAETTEELKLKLTTVVDTMERLGLQISVEKQRYNPLFLPSFCVLFFDRL